jgi:hypothetical protein
MFSAQLKQLACICASSAPGSLEGGDCVASVGEGEGDSSSERKGLTLAMVSSASAISSCAVSAGSGAKEVKHAKGEA